MTTGEIEIMIAGASLVGGMRLGYMLRGAADRWQRRTDSLKARKSPLTVMEVAGPRPTVKRGPVAKVIPLHTYAQASEAFAPRTSEPNNRERTEVIDALVGAGFKKTVSAASADACTAIEKAAGVELWIVAALRHAASGK